MVAGEGVGQAAISHDDEGDTVGQAPALVGAAGVEVPTAIDERRVGRDDLDVGVNSEMFAEPQHQPAHRGVAERIGDLDQDQLGCEHPAAEPFRRLDDPGVVLVVGVEQRDEVKGIGEDRRRGHGLGFP